jgi:hypothetical protein
MGKRGWTEEQLVQAVASSRSYRQVMLKLGILPRGGNYATIQHYIVTLDLDTSHFLGRGWNLGGGFKPLTPPPLSELLVADLYVQSFKLKLRLFNEGLKKPSCEICGWAERSFDGRIPVELDHINGNHMDNRIENLRILCPNCHSLQLTHRGVNRGKQKNYRHARVVEWFTQDI